MKSSAVDTYESSLPRHESNDDILPLHVCITYNKKITIAMLCSVKSYSTETAEVNVRAPFHNRWQTEWWARTISAFFQ